MATLERLARRGARSWPAMSTSATVTVVVPTFNSGRTIEACLASIRAQDYPEIELIVVDNSSTDPTAAIAQQYAHRVLTCGPERSAQRNHGAGAGVGATIVFIDSDMVLEPSVVSEAVAVLACDRRIGAVIIDEVAFGDGRFIGCRQLEKQLCTGDRSVEAARAFRRDAFEQAGGYDESLYACEDWDLADRVTANGWRTGRARAVIWHDEGRVTLVGSFNKKRYYGRNGNQWLRGPAASERRRRPLALLGALARSQAPAHLRAGLAVLKAVEWTGFAYGSFERRTVDPIGR